MRSEADLEFYNKVFHTKNFICYLVNPFTNSINNYKFCIVFRYKTLHNMIGPKFKVEIREINKPNTRCVKKITLSLKKNKDHIHERE